MRGCVQWGVLVLFAAFSLPAWSNVPDKATRGEKLAWHLEAYVPCKDGLGIEDLQIEVKAFDATRSELLLALNIIEYDEDACAQLKAASEALLNLALDEPMKFDVTFGFVGQGPLKNVQGQQEALPTGQNVLAPKELTPPPQASSQKTRSSY